MCGIAGIYHFHGAEADSIDAVSRMLSSISHRGPDGFGAYHDPEVCLGHARLSIIDLAGGAQPMSNEDGSVWITFNGEIFNFEELRKGLEERGHRFSTRSDTEVIIHLYEDFGHGCLEHLNGQFAFAIWDMKKRELFIARDRLGIRPLFYAERNGEFFFASEAKALFATGRLEKRIDPLALDEIFTFWHTLAPRTSFEGVHELPAGHFLVFKSGVLSRHKYWELEFPEQFSTISFEDAMDELKRLLVDSTRLQLRADVPVGAYLSGGLDSSVTTALIRNYTGSKLQTFSVAFEDGDYDESPFQKEMAEALGTEHSEIRCTYDDICESFPKVIWHTEKPVVRTAPSPLFLLAGLVRKTGFKVVLTGEGADEVLGGYDIFKEAKIRDFWARQPESNLRPLLLKKLYPYLPAFQGQSRFYREAFFNNGLDGRTDDFFSHRPRWEMTAKNKMFFAQEVKQAIEGSSPEEMMRLMLPAGFSKWPVVARAQFLETRGLLAGYILSSQGDRMAMGNSIEGRFPFLDHRVVEFAATLPLHYKIRSINEKYILKKCMAPYLPERIVKRTKQPYLAPDSKSFFKGAKTADYVVELLSEKIISEYGYFNPKPVSLLVNKCRKGSAIGFKDNMALVGILSTQLLHKQFVEDFSSSPLEKGRLCIVNSPAVA